jgi:hypothetical protein
MKIAAQVPVPNHKIASGIQAMGAIGRNVSIKGSIRYSASRIYQTHIAIDIPNVNAIQNPLAILVRLSNKEEGSSPLTVNSQKPLATPNGVGAMPLDEPSSGAQACQIARRTIGKRSGFNHCPHF